MILTHTLDTQIMIKNTFTIFSRSIRMSKKSVSFGDKNILKK